MKSYKPPKSPSFKPHKLPAIKQPKPMRPMASPKMTKLGGMRHTPAVNKETAKVYKGVYNRAYNAAGLRRVLNWFKSK